MAIERRQRGTVKIGSSRLHFGIRPLFSSSFSSPALPSLTPIPAALLLSFLLSFSRQLSNLLPSLLLLAPPSSVVRPRFPPVVMHSLAQKGEWVVQNLVEEYCDDIRMTDGTKRDLTSSSLSRYVNCVFLVPKKLESTLHCDCCSLLPRFLRTSHAPPLST